MNNRWVGISVLLLLGILGSNSANAWTVTGNIWKGLFGAIITSRTEAWQEDTENLYGFGLNVRIKKDDDVVAFKAFPNCGTIFILGIQNPCKVKTGVLLPSLGAAYCGSGEAQVYDGANLTGPVRGWSGKCVNTAFFSPSTPSASVEWEYCIGSSAAYAVDWWGASGDIVDGFVVENKTGSGSWLSIYEGAGGHCALSTPYPTQFRVKAINTALTN